MALDPKALEAAARMHDNWTGRASTIGSRNAMRNTVQIVSAYLSALGDRWQPIETCPRDGTPFLAGRFTGVPHGDHEGRVLVDWWRSRERGDEYEGLGHFNATYWPATHWRPLPAAPTPEQKP